MIDPTTVRLQARLAALVFLALSATATPGQPNGVPASRPAAIESVTTLGMTVADLDRAVSFYADVLTFEKVAESRIAGDEFAALHGIAGAAAARVARLRLGDEIIELADYETPQGRPFPADSRSNDRWFQHVAIVVADMDQAHRRLHDKMVRAASKAPQRLPDWNTSAAGIKAFYFRDPDGHFLELIEFPAGKGNPKWRRGRNSGSPAAADPLFLGIDHTAIVVRDTEASLRFYRDILGFEIAGGSENFGPEQEALNNVAAARLRITTLRAAAGPAIELLEYLTPRDGRDYPADARASDVLHWQTTLISPRSAMVLSKRLRDEKYELLSNDVVRFRHAGSERGSGFIVRDPDGHAMRIFAE